MTILFALTVAVIFGAGAALMLKRDLIRVVCGVLLISQSINLFIVAAGLTRGRAPIYPLPAGATVSDPLVQSLVLTAIVITFGVTGLLLALVYCVYTAHQSFDQGKLLEQADADEAGLERQSELAR